MIRFLTDKDLWDSAANACQKKALQARKTLHDCVGEGNDFLGWLDVRQIVNDQITDDIETIARKLRFCSDVIVVVGIGGSYLGARAVITALSKNYGLQPEKIIYAGHHLSENYYAALLKLLDTVDYSIIVVSKSGTTTEPAIAFRLLQKHCKTKYGQIAAKERIVCITDAKQGALKNIADKENYTCFSIPSDVGGRYSVLTPVGLLPVAAAGLNIKSLIAGAKTMQKKLFQQEENIALQYALLRNYLLNKGFNVEILAAFEPQLFYLQEWWKQLFGESEGKNNQGIFPASMVYTTDLHSLGQYMQQGKRLMFETFLRVKNTTSQCSVPHEAANDDCLNYLSDKRLSEINTAAESATLMAHQEGNVPAMQIMMEDITEFSLGGLLYFFEYACAVSAYMLGVNPFNQPGVENYKNNMFALLGKPKSPSEGDSVSQKN